MTGILTSCKIVEGETATRLLNSQGRKTTRLQFLSKEGEEIGKSVQVAIRVLSDEQAKQETISLNWFQKYLWAPAQILNEQGEKIWILVNKESARKRLGLSSKDLKEACENNTLGAQLKRKDVQRAETILKYTGFEMKKAFRVVKELNAFEARKNPKEGLVHLTDGFFRGRIFYHKSQFYLVEFPWKQIGHGSYKTVLSGERLDDQAQCAVLCESKRDTIVQDTNRKGLKWLKFVNHHKGYPLTYGWVKEDEALIIFQKRYDGHLREGAHLSKEEKAQIVRDQLAAVAMLHRDDKVHGNLKPENLLWFRNQEGKVEGLISGFGCATNLNGKEELAVGSYVYLAPEAFIPDRFPNETERAEKAVRKDWAKKMDVWALGLSLYVFFQEDLSEELKAPLNELCMLQRQCFDPDEEFWRFDQDEALWGDAFIKMWENKVTETQSLWVDESKITNPLEKLIVSMLQINPDKRITAQEALEGLKALLPPDEA